MSEAPTIGDEGALAINLVAPPEIAEVLAEWLLEREDIPGFASLPMSGHGSSEHSMTLAEQVAGRSRRVMFITHLPAPSAHAVLAALRQSFRGSGLHYWVTPVLESGHLD